MAELRPATDLGRWTLDLGQDERELLLAALDFARAYLMQDRLWGRSPAQSVGQVGHTTYAKPPAYYLHRLNLIDVALKTPATGYRHVTITQLNRDDETGD